MRLLIIFIITLCLGVTMGTVFRASEPKHATLVEQRRQYLIELEAMNDPTVSEFVRDWREAYPRATTANVEELGLAVQAIRNDPSQAASMTRRAKQQAIDELPFEPLFSSGGSAKPGI